MRWRVSGSCEGDIDFFLGEILGLEESYSFVERGAGDGGVLKDCRICALDIGCMEKWQCKAEWPYMKPAMAVSKWLASTTFQNAQQMRPGLLGPSQWPFPSYSQYLNAPVLSMLLAVDPRTEVGS